MFIERLHALEDNVLKTSFVSDNNAVFKAHCVTNYTEHANAVNEFAKLVFTQSRAKIMLSIDFKYNLKTLIECFSLSHGDVLFISDNKLLKLFFAQCIIK